MDQRLFDDRNCILGEGPLWHPKRNQLFWFDIIDRKLLTNHEGTAHHWQFDKCVSAAGWINKETLLIASETGLHTFDIATGGMKDLVKLEADNLVTRSNDGRADPWGGFWIGTMGKRLEREAGAIYRYFDGRFEKLYPNLTVPNAICFSPDRKYAYFTDTTTHIIMRQNLDPQGWPAGNAEPFIDLTSEKINPDGAVTDAAGNIWNAQWGAGRIACYSPHGAFKTAISCDPSQATCPAFGAEDLTTLFVTSANEGLKNPNRQDGQTFCFETDIKGLPEPQVRIP